MALVSPSHVLPTEGDDEEFILASVELEEILADGPVAPKAASHTCLITNEDNEEEDTGFELSSWVEFRDDNCCCVAPAA